MLARAPEEMLIEEFAPIPTWFGVGGRADRFCRPRSAAELRRCVQADPSLRVLGDGANLLVGDEGVGELVVSLSEPAMCGIECDAQGGRVVAMAGAKLPRLINETVRLGLGGLEGLAGIPATLGGALVMNAGGSFGQIADAVVRVHALDRDGREVTLERGEIAFSYRNSGLSGLILVSAELALTPGDAGTLKKRQLEVMAYKRRSQPLKDRSAGCAFKNPLLERPIEGLPGGAGAAGTRVSAGMLIDLAGCKGHRVGGAEVSGAHANFIVVHEGACAGDVIRVMEDVEQRVFDRFGVRLEREVVVWRRERR